MLINGNDYKISVLILLMEGEADVTVHTVENLIEGIEDGVTVSVLLNGGSNKKLRDMFESVSFIRYYESPENLGVAGGRNYLLKTPECIGSDIVMILDNDVIPPRDYLRGLSEFLLANDKSGVVGAAVASINKCPVMHIIKHFGQKGTFGNSIFDIKSADIKECMLNNLTPDKLYHIGTHPDTCYAYLSMKPYIQDIASNVLNRFKLKVKNNVQQIKNSEEHLEQIRQGIDKYAVTNVAGCSQAFRRSLVEEIGYLNDLFNPYGFEDVDFCVRALKQGYINYITTNTWLYHGTDTRHKERDEFFMIENRYRCLAILSLRLGKPRFVPKMIMFEFLRDFIFRFTWFDWFGRFKARYRGYKTGVAMIKSEGAGIACADSRRLNC